MFRHLLSNETVTTELSGESKEEIFKQLIDLLPDWQFSSKTKKKLLEMLLLRESFGTTAIGDNIALPHALLEELDVPVAVLGVSRAGVHFNALDGEAVNVIYLALFPQTEVIKKTKGEVLISAQKFFSDSFVCQQLRACQDTSAVMMILNNENQASEINEAAVL